MAIGYTMILNSVLAERGQSEALCIDFLQFRIPKLDFSILKQAFVNKELRRWRHPRKGLFPAQLYHALSIPPLFVLLDFCPKGRMVFKISRTLQICYFEMTRTIQNTRNCRQNTDIRIITMIFCQKNIVTILHSEEIRHTKLQKQQQAIKLPTKSKQ